MEASHLVSVIIPTYNRETYLKQAIASVASQTYSHIEILVIDDGSANNYAEEICDQFENCTYYFKENGGLSSARNYGLDKASGDFVAFLDDDDYWVSTKIEEQVKVLQNSPEYMLVHCPCLEVNAESEPTGKVIGAAPGKESLRSGNVFWNALGTWVVKSPTPLIRKEIFTSNFRFDETIKVGEDVDFYQRLFYKYKIYYIKEPLAYYRVYPDTARLSQQRSRYIGLELKMYGNFKKMGVTNPLVLHKIAQRLLRYAQYNWRMAHPNKSLKIPKFNAYFRPYYSLRTYFNS